MASQERGRRARGACQRVVEVSRRGELALVRIDTGGKVNLLSVGVLEQLAARLDEMSRFGSAAAVIVCGNGRGSFAAGADLAEIAALDAMAASELSRSGQAVLSRLADGPWPTGALVDGHAIGGGFDLAMACDVVVATRRSWFAHPGVRHGFFTGWGGTARLPRLMRPGPAWQALLRGDSIEARRALSMGMIAALASDRQAALTTLRDMLRSFASWSRAAREAWRSARRGAPQRGLASAWHRLGLAEASADNS
ncbi:MAG: enoyl-CoA hydratase/isomerase family protein [Acidobacteriota bacterium]|nr:MAG: enoyl-CoA hydratase/isomerase family protein [Acidobacteriota bacterium]